MSTALNPVSSFEIGSNVSNVISYRLGLQSPSNYKIINFAKGVFQRGVAAAATYGPVYGKNYSPMLANLTLIQRNFLSMCYNTALGVSHLVHSGHELLNNNIAPATDHLEMALKFGWRVMLDGAIYSYASPDAAAGVMIAEGVLSAVAPNALRRSYQNVASFIDNSIIGRIFGTNKKPVAENSRVAEGTQTSTYVIGISQDVSALVNKSCQISSEKINTIMKTVKDLFFDGSPITEDNVEAILNRREGVITRLQAQGNANNDGSVKISDAGSSAKRAKRKP
ncbi:MAG: hypothetical protein WC688_03850 [Parachlamydiales bacterium]|jgi:hypothetical protein